jgi:hypothetical protein
MMSCEETLKCESKHQLVILSHASTPKMFTRPTMPIGGDEDEDDLLRMQVCLSNPFLIKEHMAMHCLLLHILLWRAFHRHRRAYFGKDSVQCSDILNCLV